MIEFPPATEPPKEDEQAGTGQLTQGGRHGAVTPGSSSDLDMLQARCANRAPGWSNDEECELARAMAIVRESPEPQCLQKNSEAGICTVPVPGGTNVKRPTGSSVDGEGVSPPSKGTVIYASSDGTGHCQPESTRADSIPAGEAALHRTPAATGGGQNARLGQRG